MCPDGPHARDKPYIWATWLSRLLSGDGSCAWASWFKAQHEGTSWTKAPSTFDQAQWTLDHTALLSTERQRLEAGGASVQEEQQNRFVLHGLLATLAGKPDLVSLQDGELVIHDVKSGQPHTHHAVQVMVYMWAFPLARREYADLPVTGRIVYAGHTVDVPASAVDEAFVARVTDLINRLSDRVVPAPKAPSYAECRFCEITAANCPERIEEEPPGGQTRLF